MSRHIKLWSLIDADRSGKVRWTASELGYEIDEARVRIAELAAEPYTRLNPYAQVPAAEFDGTRMIESTAICLSLAERHPEAGLIPDERGPRNRFWEKLNLATTTLELPVVMYYLSKLDVIDAAWAPLWLPSLEKRLRVFADSLPGEGCLCGDFTLADICAAYVLRIGVQAELLPMEGRLERYLHRLMARPAAQAARFFEGL